MSLLMHVTSSFRLATSVFTLQFLVHLLTCNEVFSAGVWCAIAHKSVSLNRAELYVVFLEIAS